MSIVKTPKATRIVALLWLVGMFSAIVGQLFITIVEGASRLTCYI